MATKLLIEQFVRCHNQNYIENQGRKVDQLKLAVLCRRWVLKSARRRICPQTKACCWELHFVFCIKSIAAKIITQNINNWTLLLCSPNTKIERFLCPKNLTQSGERCISKLVKLFDFFHRQIDCFADGGFARRQILVGDSLSNFSCKALNLSNRLQTHQLISFSSSSRKSPQKPAS